MKIKQIKISKEFSDTPGGRFRTDGPFSGQEFRDDFLLPALNEYDKVIVDFDGGEGYGSSFLEESFGGVVELKGIDFVLGKIEFISLEDEFLIEEVKKYMEKAESKRSK